MIAKKVILPAAILFIIMAVIAFTLVFYPNLFKSSEDGYWTLEIFSSTGGYTNPNGTVQVLLGQSNIDVTAKPSGWNGFYYWTFDGERLENQSSTISIPRQQENTTHTLSAIFIIGTPPVHQIISEIITVEPNSYLEYNFSIPAESHVSGNFEVNGTAQGINVYVMNDADFYSWRNGGEPKSYIPVSNMTLNGTIDVILPQSGTYYLVYDNTSDEKSVKTVETQMTYWYIPKD